MSLGGFFIELGRITEKKWDVLWYFVTNSEDLEYYHFNDKCGVKYITDSGKKRFYSYPSRIYKDFKESYYNYKKISISKDTAGKICNELFELGILGIEMRRAPRQSGETPHYYLKEGFEPYLKIMKFFFQMVSDPMMQRVMMNTYVQKNTNDDLIRYILNRKGVEMHRSIPLIEWNAQEAPIAFEEYYKRNYWDINCPPCSFTRYVKDPKILHFPPTILLRLPVFPSGISEEEKMEKIRNLNENTFEQSDWLNKYRSGIQEHYERYEYEHWILPILALIRASPSTLNMFLFGDWKPYGLKKRDYYCFTQDGGSCMEYPLFTLLFEAIRDLAMVRNVEYDRFVREVSFRPKDSIFSKNIRPALLKINLINWISVYYDGEFDTDHLFYGCGGIDVIEAPEETNYSFQSWSILNNFLGGIFFSKDDFPMLFRFLQHIQRTNTITCRYIFNFLSHEVQNIITYSENREISSDSHIGQKIIRDLNEILLNREFYDSKIFSNLKPTEQGKMELSKDSFNYLYSFGDISTQYLNREILERTYPEYIPKRNRNEWDKTEYFSEA